MICKIILADDATGFVWNNIEDEIHIIRMEHFLGLGDSLLQGDQTINGMLDSCRSGCVGDVGIGDYCPSLAEKSAFKR